MTTIGGLPCPNCKDRIAQLQAKTDEYERVLERLGKYDLGSINNYFIKDDIKEVLSKHRQKEGTT